MTTSSDMAHGSNVLHALAIMIVTAAVAVATSTKVATRALAVWYVQQCSFAATFS